MKRFKEQLHPTWHDALSQQLSILDDLESKLSETDFAPNQQSVMRVFNEPLEKIKIVILGQDPYPNPDYAMGLAFSVTPQVRKLPQSLRNIFTEYVADTGFSQPVNGDLSTWAQNGVALLNRSLTVIPGQSNSHSEIGWREFTLGAARVLAERGVVAILWGSAAQELSHLFKYKVESAHPSPLSAYRGFFGSKPFTRSNQMLQELDMPMVNWRLP